MSKKSTLAAVLAAAAAGAAIAILFAPESGEKTRKKLAKKGEELRGKLADLVDEGRVLVDEMKGDLENKVSGYKRRTSDLADEAKDQLRNAERNIRDRA